MLSTSKYSKYSIQLVQVQVIVFSITLLLISFLNFLYSSFLDFLQELNLTLTDSELENMIKDASVSGNQQVTEQEYVHILKNASWI
jgi:hypothetical protein